MSRRRVVITGMGAVTPLGCCVEKYWDGLISARSGIGPITHFDASEFDTHIGGECRDFNSSEWIDGKAAKRMYNVFRLTGRYLRPWHPVVD